MSSPHILKQFPSEPVILLFVVVPHDAIPAQRLFHPIGMTGSKAPATQFNVAHAATKSKRELSKTRDTGHVKQFDPSVGQGIEVAYRPRAVCQISRELAVRFGKSDRSTCTVDRALNAATTMVAVVSIKVQGSPCEAA